MVSSASFLSSSALDFRFDFPTDEETFLLDFFRLLEV